MRVKRFKDFSLNESAFEGEIKAKYSPGPDKDILHLYYAPSKEDGHIVFPFSGDYILYTTGKDPIKGYLLAKGDTIVDYENGPNGTVTFKPASEDVKNGIKNIAAEGNSKKLYLHLGSTPLFSLEFKEVSDKGVVFTGGVKFDIPKGKEKQYTLGENRGIIKGEDGVYVPIGIRKSDADGSLFTRDDDLIKEVRKEGIENIKNKKDSDYEIKNGGISMKPEPESEFNSFNYREGNRRVMLFEDYTVYNSTRKE